ncbi:MAG TPA: xanthine dehydrogenase family protein molybdopterin-binding subunit [Chloroflexia bacterium]|jgi:xanthine dehydrogenase YagR molybdenum-binding subunit
MTRVVKTKIEIEGRVHEETVVMEREEPEAWEAGREFTQVGKSANRVDGRERVTGAARYTYDVHPAGLLYAAVLRCPHPHARIVSLDTTAAESLPGVRAVLSKHNAPDISWYAGASKLFDEELRFAGEEVAVVAADDLDTARDALKLIKVEYEVLPAALDVDEASSPDAPVIHPKGNVLLDDDGNRGETYTRGNIEKGFKSADVVVEGTYTTPTALHNSFETHGCVASWEGDEITIWESTQYIFGVRGRVASALKLPVSSVRVISEYMGGGFGSKGQTLKHSVIAPLLSRMTGRPIKYMLDRHEENLLSGNRGETVQKLRVGATKKGKLVAIELETLCNIGAYGTWAASVAGPAQELYTCANVRTYTLGVRTNLGSHAAFRAPGHVEGTFALESAIDELCRQLSMDPVEFRKKNYAESDQVSGKAYSSKYLLESYEMASRLHAEAGAPSLENLPAGNWKVGTGMGSQVWSGGGGPPAHALVRLNSDGTIEVICGTQDIGTGIKTALSQVAAEELGVPLESVRFRLGDTQKGPFGPASWGSITVPSVGPAVRVAAEDAKQQLLDIASYFFEVPAKRLQIKDGYVTVEGREEGRRSIGDVLSEVGDYMIVGKGFRGPNPVEPLRTWGAQIADVAVDLDTGRVRVLRVVAVHDVGRVLNPKGLASQFYGGILQGIGLTLMEDRVVDERTGLVVNANLQDYKVPTMPDAPEMIVRAVDIPDTAANHIGSKGAGEPPIIPTPAAIANAIYDAVGVRVRDLPVTPKRLLDTLAAQQTEARQPQESGS